MEHFHDPTNPISEVAQLKMYIEYEMEKRINAMPHLGLEDLD